MGIWKSLAGTVRVELTSASPADMLTAINQSGIPLSDVMYLSELSVACTVLRSDYKLLHSLITRRGESVSVNRRTGSYWAIKRLIKRPVLMFGMAFLLLLAIYLPTRVLFVEVEGNESIPATLIIENAENCGISFGASRREVRSEQMKNALLGAIPELQWAGINTYGCTAVISVKERTVSEQIQKPIGVNSIVAAKDGVIQSCTVLRGNALCKVGQAVKKGQVLVSGYTDCGIAIKATGAEAEIFAQTLHTLSAVTPTNAAVRDEKTEVETKYSLFIGKKLINFSQDSGISDSTCVKMYTRINLTLPGGFQLPIGLIQEKLIYCDYEQTEVCEESSFVWVQDYSEAYLQEQMVAGQILNANTGAELMQDVYFLSGQFSCIEMIGRTQSEEIIK